MTTRPDDDGAARRPRSRRIMVAAVAVVLVLVVLGIGAAVNRRTAPASALAGVPPSRAAARALVGPQVTPPMVLAYFFYWYDAQTNQHLRPQDGLPVHLPPDPGPSWRSEAWFEQQFHDMADADVDVALPDYWGSSPDQAWSIDGLGPMVAARHALVAAHQTAPRIGMFYDTSVVRGVDLTSAAGIDEFYANIRTYFQHVPQSDWALADGRPIIWLFLPQGNRFDQTVFTATYQRFTQDFGVRPYIVSATGWDCASTVPNCGQPIQTDATYVWGVAQDGMHATALVAAAGPGYDDRQVPGRAGTYVARDGGAYFEKNLTAAARSGRPFVAIETWNEIHEASAIGDTVEYGRQYIDLTRSIIEAARVER